LPGNRVTIAADEAVVMDMVSGLIDEQRPTFRPNPSRTIPVSLSPNNSTVNNPAALLTLNLLPPVAGRGCSSCLQINKEKEVQKEVPSQTIAVLHSFERMCFIQSCYHIKSKQSIVA
jgi:hypothetical protein